MFSPEKILELAQLGLLAVAGGVANNATGCFQGRTKGCR